MTKLPANWKRSDWETLPDGSTVKLWWADFGKGRAAVRSWKMFRNDEQVGYASTMEDAEVNWGRVRAGMVRNSETGRYEKRDFPEGVA